MSEQTAQLTVNLLDNASAGIAKIQKALKSFTFDNVEKFSRVFTNSSFTGGVGRTASSFKSMASSAAGAAQAVGRLSSAMQGLNQWSQKTVETQTKIQKSLGLLATKVTDITLKEFADSMNIKVDISDPEQKIKLLNQYLRSVKKDAQNWTMGLGEFAKVAPMSFQSYIDQIKQLESSGLTGIEATLATRYSAAMSKALEATHVDAAYDMARVFNVIKATTKGGLIDKEATFRQISSLFDFMDNTYQFKIGRYTIAQMRKTISVGLSRGFQLEDLGVAAGNISSAGLEGGMGDTALKEFISRLSIAEGKAKKAGLAFSYNFGQSLPDIIRNLNKATAGLDDKSRTDFFRDAFGERGVLAVNVLINSADKMEKEIREAQKATTGLGSAFRSAFLRAQDFSTSQDRLSYQIDYFNGRVGVYTAGIRWMFTDLAASSLTFVRALQNSKTTVGTFVGDGIAGFMTFGGVVTAFGADLISMAAAPLSFMGNLGLAMDGMEKSRPHLKKFGEGIVNLGKGMVVTGLGAVKSLGSGLLWLGKTSVIGAWGAIKLLGSSLLWLGKTAITGTLSAFKMLGLGIWGLVKGMFSLTVATFRAIFSQQFWTKTLWQGIAAGAKNIITLTLMGISYAFIAVKGAIASAVSAGFWLVTTIGSWAAAIPLGVVALAFLAIVAAIGLVVGSIYLLWKHWDTVWGWIKKNALTIGLVFLAIMPAITVIVGAIYLLWKNWDKIWGWIKNSFSGAINFIVGGFRWLWNFADKITFGFLGKLWNGLKFVFGWLWDKLKQLGKWLGYYFEGDKTLSLEGESALSEGLGASFSEGASYGGSGGGGGKGLVIPEGAYAYQINKRIGDVSSAKTAIGAGTMANAAIPIDTEKDLLRDIVGLLKEIRDKNPESLQKKTGNRSERPIIIQNASFPGVADLESMMSIVNEFSEAVTLTSE